MSKARITSLVCALPLVCGNLLAQTPVASTNFFGWSIYPTNNSILVAETTNAVLLSITNFLTITVDENTNSITNVVFTNVTATADWMYDTNTNTLIFLDNGKKPDKKANDGIFTTNLITPTTLDLTNLDLNFFIQGDDLAYTNDQGQLEPARLTNSFTVTYRLVPRPVNDRLTNAYKILGPGGVITATNNYASMEPGEPKHAKAPTVDASVWWLWSSPVSTNVLIDLAGSSFDPVLAVYTGDASFKQLIEVASATNDVANKLKAHVNFNAVAGVTYRIAVAGWDTNGVGNIRLRVAPGATPDKRSPLVSITSPGKEAVVTSGAVSISGTAKEPVLNDSGISNVVIQVNSDPPTNATGTSSWSGYITLPPGTNIVRAFAVDYAGNVGPADSIVVRYLDPPNDNFSDATALTGVSGLLTNLNGRATLEPAEPLHSGNAGGRSIWYSWRAPANGTLSLSTEGSNFDTLLDVYLGTNFTSLVNVASNDDAHADSKYSALTLNVISNQLYAISVDGFGGAFGHAVLQYAFVAPSPSQYYALVVSASLGGRVSPPSNMYPAGSRVDLTATPDKDFEFVDWEGDLSAANNPLTVTMNQDYKILARFRLSTGIVPGISNAVTEDFESGHLKHLPWTNSTTAPWNVQTNIVSTGNYAARSARIGDGQKSTLALATNMVAGVASFDLKVSSEADWDFLAFSLNGHLLERWSGEIGWTNYLFTVPAGTNRLEWSYAKDNSFSAGLDAAFIDNLYIPLALPNTNGLAATLLLTHMPDGQAQITLQGQPSRNYQLEVSTDLVFWFPVEAKASANGIVQFLDAEATQYPIRFYRAAAQ